MQLVNNCADTEGAYIVNFRVAYEEVDDSFVV